jgi:hypothetical protein
MAAKTKTDASEALKQLTYLASALKAPRITESAARLADHARDAGWTHEEYLAAVLDREVRYALSDVGGQPGTAVAQSVAEACQSFQPSCGSSGVLSVTRAEVTAGVGQVDIDVRFRSV